MTWNPEPDESPTRAFHGVPSPSPGYPPQPEPTVLRTPAGPPPEPASARTVTTLILPLAIGAGVAVVLGVYGKVHTPTGIAVSVAGFSGPLTVKVWLATVAIVFAVVQLVTALAMWGKLPLRGSWVSPVHRWSGRIAFVLTIPVVVHCLYALGFATYDVRTLAHSLLGCVFFGVFTTKMLVLTKHGLAGWVLPLFGGAVFAALVGVWATSALWFFTTTGLQF
ncbi:DUF6529 family protein [Cryptosporangium sp. NPDC048952]|uniref:DUF6529 family protein n=1 Tax=Cryptosporangium sp. NPDC048952 TaxID=3363961 RepID=UPI00371410BF